MKNGTSVVRCTCQNEFQDKQYGQGNRLANATAKQDKDQADVRCTVCSKIHSVNLSRIK